MEKIDLGDSVRDVVTGATGIVQGITRWITGCDTISINRGIKDDGTIHDLLYVDINRVVLLEKGAVQIDNSDESMQPNAPAHRRTGGPQDHGAPNKAPR